MGIFDNLGKLLWNRGKESKIHKVKTPDVKDVQVVTAHEVLYYVPTDMKSITAEILDTNGRIKGRYVLTRYISIKPGERIRLKTR